MRFFAVGFDISGVLNGNSQMSCVAAPQTGKFIARQEQIFFIRWCR
jgi:hypothetical protein